MPRVLTVACAVMLWGPACGGHLASDLGSDAGPHRDGGRAGSRGDGSITPPVDDAHPADDFRVYHEDACPDAPVAVPPLQCDPLTQRTCPPGEGCYPIPPRAIDDCHPGTFSTMCAPAGTGTQGAPCGDGSDCAAGFVCVITGAGNQCVKLCRTSDFGACTDGRVCRPIDITGSGWGGCE